MKRHYYVRRDVPDMDVEILVFESARACDYAVRAFDGKAHRITAQEAYRWGRSGRKRFATFYDMTKAENWDRFFAPIYAASVKG